MTEAPHLQDSPIVRFVSRGLAIYSLAFAFFIVVLGTYLTSKQWTYLLSIPGGRWTWGLMFGTAGLISLCGQRKQRHRTLALGEALMGSWCLSIVLFYVVAPLFESSLLTLGFMPWIGMATLMFAWAAIHVSDKPW